MLAHLLDEFQELAVELLAEGAIAHEALRLSGSRVAVRTPHRRTGLVALDCKIGNLTDKGRTGRSDRSGWRWFYLSIRSYFPRAGTLLQLLTNAAIVFSPSLL